ncbi:LCP family protein [Streptomyces sp. NPDC005438]|uniref:LCP family protein n=1 Tax=Streptomyces sp. NPDC005438 TaxID=3156880 RepID=UPI0033B0151D
MSPRPRYLPRPRWLALVLPLCAVLLCTGALWQAPELVDPMSRVRALPTGEAGRPPKGPGTNLLVVGTDTREGLSRETKERLKVGGKECHCTDVMMLVHLSADRRRMSVVSIPRDSYVPFARHRDGGPKGRMTSHSGKINAAYDHGGPALTVATVEKATHVRVDHYLETDFTRFVDAVDDLGGATMCTDRPLRDENSGLDLATGTHRLDGPGALSWVRARHVSPPGDLGRVRRQQKLVVQMMGTLAQRKVFQDPAALARTAKIVSDHVTVDSELDLAGLVRLGRSLRKLDLDRSEFATVPIAEFDYRAPQWGSSLLWDKKRAATLFTDLRKDLPLTDNPVTQPGPGTPVEMAPAEVSVRVRPGPDAGKLADRLRAEGFQVTRGAGKAPASPPRHPVITYAPAYERQAQVLAAALPQARLRAEPGHGPRPQVTPGTQRTRVSRLVVDRSSVEGAPITGDRLRCPRHDDRD